LVGAGVALDGHSRGGHHWRNVGFGSRGQKSVRCRGGDA